MKFNLTWAWSPSFFFACLTNCYMVKTRSGKVTGKVTTKRSTIWRYPKCKKHPKGGVMCATCSRAGQTKAGYEAYFNKNKRRAMVRPTRTHGAPPPRK